MRVEQIQKGRVKEEREYFLSAEGTIFCVTTVNVLCIRAWILSHNFLWTRHTLLTKKPPLHLNVKPKAYYPSEVPTSCGNLSLSLIHTHTNTYIHVHVYAHSYMIFKKNREAKMFWSNICNTDHIIYRFTCFWQDG